MDRRPFRWRWQGRTLLLAAALAAALQGEAQTALTLVVAASPGTGVDILAREVGQQFMQARGTAVVVDNRAGASGNLGAEFVARAKPDGATLLVGATTFATNASVNAATLPYDPQKDFVPVALLGTGTLCLVVSSSFPASTIQQFIAQAKAAPGKINYASPGNGTPQHLAMELVKLEAGIDLFHVPFKATSSAINDVAGGHVSAMIAPIHTVLPLVTAGKLKLLAVLSPERLASLPKVPTFKEVGLPRLQLDVWYGLFAPAATPPAVVAQLNRDVNQALKGKGVAENLARQGIEPGGGAPQVLADKLQAELTRWPPVVKAAHITAD
jgi:tripartite-type tricarboxylate transporter receptor subunit TctC